MASIETLTNLNINVLTKEQLDSATTNSNDIYMTTDDVMPIEFGGTGANNAEDARTNLGVYSKSEIDSSLSSKANSSHNHDSAYAPKTHSHSISEVTNLQTTLNTMQEDINGKAPAYTFGTEDLEEGVSILPAGTLYFVFETGGE